MTDDLVFRALESDADAAVFARVMSRSFAFALDEARVWPDMLGRENVRLLERGEHTIATLAFYPMAQHFGGRAVACAGVAGVGVEPGERGSGLGTVLMQHGLRELFARGFALSALYPASLMLYGGVGYEIAGARYQLRVPLRTLTRTGRDRAQIVAIESHTDPLMRACYARVALERNGWLARSEPMWMRVQTRRGMTREGFGLVRDGQMRAYVWFAKRTLENGHFDLDCGDLVAEDAPAARGILAFLGSYATIGQELVAPLAPWDPIVGAIPECTWSASLHLPWMLRIVDVRRALEARGYPRALRARSEIAVVDALLPANAARFVVMFEGGTASVAPGGGGAIEIDVRGLAALYAGYADGATLRARSLVRGAREDIDTFAAAFAGGAPSMQDFF